MCILLLVIAAGQVPVELQHARAARQWKKADITWTYLRHLRYDGDKPPVKGIFEARYAPNNAWLLKRRQPGGYSSDFNTLRYEDRWWVNTNTPLYASIFQKGTDRDVIDARTLGMYPNGRLQEELKGGELSYEVADDGAYRLVTTTVTKPGPQHSHQIRQWIDPARDWSVVRSSWVREDGSVAQEMVVEEFIHKGNVWFPKRIGIYFPERSAAPAYTIEVTKFRVDEPGLPDSLGPADIGVQVGTSITMRQDDGSVATMGWNGEKMEPFMDVATKVNRGELQLGPDYKIAEQEATRQSVFTVVFFADLGSDAETLGDVVVPKRWEQYVHDFIRKHKLTEAQQQRAWEIHGECKSRADAYETAHRAELDEIDESLHELQSRESSTEQIIGELKELAGRKAKLSRPVVRIFQQELQPRLRALLTKEQAALEP